MDPKEWEERNAKELMRENRRNSNDMWYLVLGAAVVVIFCVFMFGGCHIILPD